MPCEKYELRNQGNPDKSSLLKYERISVLILQSSAWYMYYCESLFCCR